MPNALITGISGFVGNHLSTHLRELGWQVYGFDQHAGADRTNTFVGDIANHDVFKAALHKCKPDIVFHMAGLIKAAQPEKLYSANFLGTVSLFEALLKSGQCPIVIVASSSAVYGSGLGRRLITENFKPRPVTHYAVSKLVQEIAALRYFAAFQLPVIIVRMFNLLGPGQSPDLACSAFARQIALAEINGDHEIITGDLSARRDFVDVRDAVRAITLVSEKGIAGQIYNICSGHAVSMKKCLDEMFSMSPHHIQARVDAGNIQKHDVSIQVGNPHKLNQLTGWHTQITLRQSLADLLDYWRQRVK